MVRFLLLDTTRRVGGPDEPFWLSEWLERVDGKKIYAKVNIYSNLRWGPLNHRAYENRAGQNHSIDDICLLEHACGMALCRRARAMDMRETAREFSMEVRLRDDPSALSPSLAELATISLLGAPCCGHIALCDGRCRDALPPNEDGVRPAGLEPR